MEELKSRANSRDNALSLGRKFIARLAKNDLWLAANRGTIFHEGRGNSWPMTRTTHVPRNLHNLLSTNVPPGSQRPNEKFRIAGRLSTQSLNADLAPAIIIRPVCWSSNDSSRASFCFRMQSSVKLMPLDQRFFGLNFEILQFDSSFYNLFLSNS